MTATNGFFGAAERNTASAMRRGLSAVCLLLGLSAAAGPADASDRLSPCPASPNCVSSQAADQRRRVAPLAYGDSPTRARQRLLAILNRAPRVRMSAVEEDYIHAEFRSRVFRFVDDMEFYFVPDSKVVHVRSASRVGYYDFGANRRRVEEIRRAFETP